MKNNYIVVRVTDAQKAVIGRYAADQERTVSSLILMALRTYGVQLKDCQKLSTSNK